MGPIYVLHYKPVANRKASIVKQFALAGIQHCTFVEQYDAEELTEDIVNSVFNKDKDVYAQKVARSMGVFTENIFYRDKKPWGEGVNYSQDIQWPTPDTIRYSDLSLIIKHSLAWNDIHNNHEYGIIFEDDIIMLPGFIDEFEAQIANTPSDWDIIFFGSGCGFRVPERTKGRGVYKMDPPRAKPTDSYVVSKKAAKILSENFFPVSQRIDWEMQCVCMNLGLSVYWWEPPLTVQGTEIGLYQTTQPQG